MTEHFRGVVWPRGSEDGTRYRYVVVGMLVTDAPIVELPGSQIVLDGVSHGLADAIRLIRQRKPVDERLGTANDVLLTMADWVMRDDE